MENENTKEIIESNFNFFNIKEEKKRKYESNSDENNEIVKVFKKEKESNKENKDNINSEENQSTNSIKIIENKIEDKLDDVNYHGNSDVSDESLNCGDKYINNQFLTLMCAVSNLHEEKFVSGESRSDESEHENIAGSQVQHDDGGKIKIKRNKINLIDKEKIINAYENGGNMKHLAGLMGIKYKTIVDIIYRYNSTAQITSGKRGGIKKSIITEEIGNCLLQFIDEHYRATLNDMISYLSVNHGLSPCKTTISNFLRNKYITCKKLKYSQLEENSDQVKDIRCKYVTKYLRDEYRPSQCIYIEETSINAWVQREVGRSTKDQGVYHHIYNQRGPNFSLVLAISKKGPVHYKVIIGSFEHNSYQEFVTQLSIKLPATIHYLIHDNAFIHNDTISTTAIHHIVNLPPYSSFLNPINTLFNVLKSKLRQKLSSMNLSSTNPLAKKEIIENLVADILRGENVHDLSNHYRHIKKFFPECLWKNDIINKY